ncbi:hypothetical protein KAU55_00255 [Candidatus Bathyarchaeota archaeon]|nr:hypothetical protein [Candidatus Bathyarchaeota archaeon]
MAETPKRGDLGILWSHNEQEHPRWLDTIMQTCTSRPIWWDVGWQLVPGQFIFPLVGYIWSTVEKQATHRASIKRIERQPSEKLVEEVRKSWRECNIYVNPNTPLLLYLKNKDRKCTLLKLASLKILLHPGKLEDFVLAKKGRPIKQAPQSVAIVIDPHLL